METTETTAVRQSLLYDILLPKIEWVSWLIAIWGFVAAWYQIGRWATWSIVGLTGLGIVFFLGAFAPQKISDTDEFHSEALPSQNQRNQFSTEKGDASFSMNTLITKVSGIASGVVLIGTLFKLMFWNGYTTMLLVGTGSIASVLLFMALNQRLNVRALILAILGSVMLYIPSEALVRKLRRDDPKLVELMVYQLYHPRDRAAAKAVIQRINQTRQRR